jgi:Alternative complex III, ActD subunit
MSGGVLAAFESEHELKAALESLRGTNVGEIETYTPTPIEAGPTIMPLIILIGGVLGTIASFCLQSYGATLAYPLDIGGRPNLSWPAFIPIAFENGILAAILAGFFGYLIVNRLPWLYDPVDECASMRGATRDIWCVAIRTDRPDHARAALHDLRPLRIEALP